MLPTYGVFDTVRFEVQGKTVTLSGQVVKESVKQNAGRWVGRINGVESVVNHIEVLPSSRRDDALRMNVYRAIYEKQPLEKFGARAAPPIHIIVKDGWTTLEGVVDSDADRNMVHLRALKETLMSLTICGWRRKLSPPRSRYCRGSRWPVSGVPSHLFG